MEIYMKVLSIKVKNMEKELLYFQMNINMLEISKKIKSLARDSKQTLKYFI